MFARVVVTASTECVVVAGDTCRVMLVPGSAPTENVGIKLAAREAQ